MSCWATQTLNRCAWMQIWFVFVLCPPVPLLEGLLSASKQLAYEKTWSKKKDWKRMSQDILVWTLLFCWSFLSVAHIAHTFFCISQNWAVSDRACLQPSWPHYWSWWYHCKCSCSKIASCVQSVWLLQHLAENIFGDQQVTCAAVFRSHDRWMSGLHELRCSSEWNRHQGKEHF